MLHLPSWQDDAGEDCIVSQQVVARLCHNQTPSNISHSPDIQEDHVAKSNRMRVAGWLDASQFSKIKHECDWNKETWTPCWLKSSSDITNDLKMVFFYREAKKIYVQNASLVFPNHVFEPAGRLSESEAKTTEEFASEAVFSSSKQWPSVPYGSTLWAAEAKKTKLILHTGGLNCTSPRTKVCHFFTALFWKAQRVSTFSPKTQIYYKICWYSFQY